MSNYIDQSDALDILDQFEDVVENGEVERMKICNATGNGICVNCNHVPPKVNGYSYGNICRMNVEDILEALEYGNIVCYNSDNGKFYEKTMYEHPRDFINDDWERIE